MKIQQCSECGASLRGVENCRDYFNQMLVWDFEDFNGAGSVHHLTVLCYHMQHPSLYSRVALTHAKQFLKEVIQNNLSAKELLEKSREFLVTKVNDSSVKGSPGNHGTYSLKILWSMTADKVIADGLGMYQTHVNEWAQSIYNDIKSQEGFI